MSDVSAIQRQLKIKSGAAKRIFKEHNFYRNELEQNKIKLDKLKAEGETDDWAYRNANNIHEESKKMVKDSASQLGKIVAELRDLIIDARKRPEFAEDPELLAAEGVIEEVSV